jgi:hypothetical protein
VSALPVRPLIPTTDLAISLALMTPVSLAGLGIGRESGFAGSEEPPLAAGIAGSGHYSRSFSRCSFRRHWPD